MFTRQHYKAIANIIRKAKSPTLNDADRVLYIEIELGGFFVADNPRFDWNKFIQACLQESNNENQV